jgi:MoCo/4Fe-4S cofactor protein with predicted Tat translocation signal
LAGSEEFQEMLHREFPKGASEWLDDFSRRGFLKTMGASLALAGLTGCTKMPNTEIVPYVRQPENLIPGRPMFYATAFTLGGYASPILVESHLYRPTKVEGNPQHPASLGGTDIYAQASILDLYDPDRAQNVTYLGDVRSWDAFTQAIRGPMNVEKGIAGGGVRILTQTVSSPTLTAQIKDYLEANPQAKWHVYEPINRDNVYEGAKLAFGEPVETRYDLSKADVIVSLDADFLYAGFPGSARYTRDFAARRNPDANMNRLYVIESTPSSTGMKADHRLPVKAGDVENFARALGGSIGLNTAGNGSSEPKMFIPPLAKDLLARKGSSVVIAGDHQPPAVHAARPCNESGARQRRPNRLLHRSCRREPCQSRRIATRRSCPQTCAPAKSICSLIVGGNPAYDAPAELEFAFGFEIECRRSESIYIGSASQRNRGILPVACARSALSRVLERCPRLRRHRQHRSAAHRAALRRQERRMRSSGVLAGQSGVHWDDDLVQSPTGRSSTPALTFDAFWRKVAARRLGRGHHLLPRKGVVSLKAAGVSAQPASELLTQVATEPMRWHL